VLDLTLPPEQDDRQETPKDLPLASAKSTTGDRGVSNDTARTETKSSTGSSNSTGSSDDAKAKATNSGDRAEATTAAGPSSASKATAKATLNLTAEPSAMVLVDGRPLGHTPQRISVEPGPHALLFVHPVHGRSKASVNVQAGQTRNLHARF
jgi:hypothetical protein